jgi:CRISPR-associated exonuclease Cas4
MNGLLDEQHRIRALTDLGATLLVEAAAGTGKTSLLAGRVVVLLASGVAPREIAAITFTEFAAGELRERVTRFLTDVLAGQMPEELRLAFPEGATAEQRVALEAARGRLDELTCSTIHRFCHDLLRIYAVEAGIDPGADILDEVQGDLAFASIFERWLRKRLDDMEAANDPIARVAQNDPIGAEKLLRALAEFRREHRTARPLLADIGVSADSRFVRSVEEFRRWFDATSGPPLANEDVRELEQLAEHFRGQFDPLPSFDALWRLAHPTRVSIMRARVFDLQPYQRRGAWRRVAGPAEGTRLADEAVAHYNRCAETFRELIGKLATAIVSIFSAELDTLLTTFENFKRDAAVLDFDDLLYTTRRVLRQHNEVREAAAGRFRRILVDEFQDTDPIQSEIVFLLASSGEAIGPWHARRLLPGRLFMVGDPKQAIYRFRGADVATYRQAREVVERQFPGNVIRVTSNFRSCAQILRHVDRCFQTPLAAQEAGYVMLEPTRGDPDHGLPCVAKIKVDVIPQTRVNNIRDEEAKIVAETCARLIGNVAIRRHGETSLLTPGDIALLAPTGTELWRYERALEEAELPFSSQAGKNLYRRQEVQDLVALVRALADSRDTLALGALLRGPLVGLTEQELLDVTQSLPGDQADAAGSPRLSLRTDPASIQHPLLRETLLILRDLRRRVRSTTPSLLIAEAVERLGTRAILMARSSDQASRAISNVDAILERARAYGVRGFRQFAQEFNGEWSRHAPHVEGVVDAEQQSIAIVTIHSAKGLEWPVVIPINTASGSRPLHQFVHSRTDDTLQWVLGDIVPPSLAEAMTSEAAEASQERLRLLYVACTRAMDLLVLPELSWADDATWARAIDFKLPDVPELDISHLAKKPVERAPGARNGQTLHLFEAQQAHLDQSFRRIHWIRPSDADPDIVPVEMPGALAWEQTFEPAPQTAGSSMRGVILHKLMEELLTGEVAPSVEALRRRCAALMAQLPPTERSMPRLDVDELAATAWRTFCLPELAHDQEELVPEVPVYGRIAGGQGCLVSGRADAVRYQDSRARIVFDWKSDVSPETATRAAYAHQLAQYVQALGADRGAIVYMTTGQIDWIDAAPLTPDGSGSSVIDSQSMV